MIEDLITGHGILFQMFCTIVGLRSHLLCMFHFIKFDRTLFDNHYFKKINRNKLSQQKVEAFSL
jgi:hypothetical protein